MRSPAGIRIPTGAALSGAGRPSFEPLPPDQQTTGERLAVLTRLLSSRETDGDVLPGRRLRPCGRRSAGDPGRLGAGLLRLQRRRPSASRRAAAHWLDSATSRPLLSIRRASSADAVASSTSIRWLGSPSDRVLRRRDRVDPSFRSTEPALDPDGSTRCWSRPRQTPSRRREAPGR